MSQLTENPDLMLEVLAVLVRRLGGDVTIRADETPGPFDLASKSGNGMLRLILDETLTSEDVVRLDALDAIGSKLVQ